MDFQQLKSFIRVAECRSITKAADSLFLSVSALKQQMDSLETATGVSLFVRSPKGVVLTPAGEYFYEKSTDIITRMDDILWETRNIDSDSSATVYVGFRHIKISDYLYPEFLLSFFKRYPGANVKLVDMNRCSYRNVDLLICDYIGNAEFNQSYHLRDIPVKCIMNIAHPLASRESIDLDVLKDYQLIVPPLPMLKFLSPSLAAKLHKSGYDLTESILNKDVIYMNLLHSDYILITFGDEKYLNSVLTQIALNDCFIDYSITTRKQITKPIVSDFLNLMLDFYRAR